MNKSTKAPTRERRSLCVIEVLVPATGPCSFVDCVLSLRGREGTLSRTWKCVDQVMDDSTYTDLCAWIESTILDAVEQVGGVHLSFDML